MLNTRDVREIFRKHIFDGGAKPAYKPEYYKVLIKAHKKTLTKYLSQFNKYFKIKYGVDMSPKRPSVRDVLNVLLKNKSGMMDDFIAYLIGKTNFSYELYQPPKVEETKWKSGTEFKRHLETRDEQQASTNKLGEFVFIILAEYIVLHNYMWSSGLKPKGIRTFDKFLKEIN